MKRTPSLVISLMLAILPVTLIADDNAQSPGPRIGRLAASKILFLGNSITLHSPAPAIGWTGNWGMAASAEHLDYVHLLTADIAAASGEQPTVMVKNIADFERVLRRRIMTLPGVGNVEANVLLSEERRPGPLG